MKKQKSESNMIVLLRKFSEATMFLQEAIARKAGLTFNDYKYLNILLQHGAITAGELSRLTGLTTGAITGIIDRLENKKLVSRAFDKDDRRKIVIVPDDKRSAKLLAATSAEFQDRTLQVMANFSETEVQLIERYLDITNDSMLALADKLNGVEQKPENQPAKRPHSGPRSLKQEENDAVVSEVSANSFTKEDLVTAAPGESDFVENVNNDEIAERLSAPEEELYASNTEEPYDEPNSDLQISEELTPEPLKEQQNVIDVAIEPQSEEITETDITDDDQTNDIPDIKDVDQPSSETSDASEVALDKTDAEPEQQLDESASAYPTDEAVEEPTAFEDEPLEQPYDQPEPDTTEEPDYLHSEFTEAVTISAEENTELQPDLVFEEEESFSSDDLSESIQDEPVLEYQEAETTIEEVDLPKESQTEPGIAVEEAPLKNQPEAPNGEEAAQPNQKPKLKEKDSSKAKKAVDNNFPDLFSSGW